MRKSSSRRRNRSRSPDDSKSKRTRTRSKSREREKVKDAKSAPRKTRWETEEKCKKNVKKQASSPEPTTPKKEKPGLPRIKDCLEDKEKIVNLIFQTVTGAALQDLIPDYLKNRSTEDLKKLCLEQLKKMSDELILQVISGKVDFSNKEEKAVEKEKILKPEQPSSPNKNEVKEVKSVSEKKSEVSIVAISDKSPFDVSLLREVKHPGKDEMIPLVIKDEVAKDLILPERDADLLELEMRARAIRSLLKAKSHSANEHEAKADK